MFVNNDATALVQDFLKREGWYLFETGRPGKQDAWRSKSVLDLIRAFVNLSRVILADTEKEMVEMLSDLAGFTKSVVIGDSCLSYAKIDPVSRDRLPPVFEWTDFPGTNKTTTFVECPAGFVIHYCKHIGIYGSTSGGVGLCVCVSGTYQPLGGKILVILGCLFP